MGQSGFSYTKLKKGVHCSIYSFSFDNKVKMIAEKLVHTNVG